MRNKRRNAQNLKETASKLTGLYSNLSSHAFKAGNPRRDVGNGALIVDEELPITRGEMGGKDAVETTGFVLVSGLAVRVVGYWGGDVRRELVCLALRGADAQRVGGQSDGDSRKEGVRW